VAVEQLKRARELSSRYPGHEAVWYHRRFIVGFLARAAVEAAVGLAKVSGDKSSGGGRGGGGGGGGGRGGGGGGGGGDGGSSNGAVEGAGQGVSLGKEEEGSSFDDPSFHIHEELRSAAKGFEQVDDDGGGTYQRDRRRRLSFAHWVWLRRLLHHVQQHALLPPKQQVAGEGVGERRQQRQQHIEGEEGIAAGSWLKGQCDSGGEDGDDDELWLSRHIQRVGRAMLGQRSPHKEDVEAGY
jgi:hypothetical protein